MLNFDPDNTKIFVTKTAGRHLWVDYIMLVILASVISVFFIPLCLEQITDIILGEFFTPENIIGLLIFFIALLQAFSALFLTIGNIINFIPRNFSSWNSQHEIHKLIQSVPAGRSSYRARGSRSINRSCVRI